MVSMYFGLPVKTMTSTTHMDIIERLMAVKMTWRAVIPRTDSEHEEQDYCDSSDVDMLGGL